MKNEHPGRLLVAVAMLAAGLGAGVPAPGAAADDVKVYKSPTCGCCGKWVDHMKAAGFDATADNVDDMSAVKGRLGVASRLASCHTAVVGGYVLEGHVPAAAVKKLLAERPKGVRGLAVPGMPMGSPGMEAPRADRYDVVAFDATGATRTYLKMHGAQPQP